MEQRKERRKRCDQILAERFFLIGFDFLEYNTFYNFYVYSVFLAIDFLFIAYFPLHHIYLNESYKEQVEEESKDEQVGTAIQFLNFGATWLEEASFSEYITMQQRLWIGFAVVVAGFFFLILTRDQETISLSNQRKFVTKVYSFIMITLCKSLQMVFVAFMFRVFNCDPDTHACFEGTH